MANDNHRLNLEENSKYRVAYDLMQTVASFENKSFADDEQSRKYYFDLYSQSLRVVYYGENYDKVVSRQNETASADRNATSQQYHW